jgi:CRP-like cAMP-binding protein
MKIYSSKRESYIFKEGDDAEKFFIISEGEVEVIIQGEAKKQLKKG